VDGKGSEARGAGSNRLLREAGVDKRCRGTSACLSLHTYCCAKYHLFDGHHVNVLAEVL
jgi:hypothetical protein